MQKSRIIIIEGPQGTGKTTLANYLRDNIASSNLYRLSGQRDKSTTGKDLSQKMYFTLTEYLINMQSIPMDLIFDRTFFSEEIYARLGYKEYSFTDVYDELVNRLSSLNYDIYYITLYLEDTNLYKSRLQREEHHNYQSFSLQNSQDQQNIYLELAKELEEKNAYWQSNSKNQKINVINIAMDDFEKAYKQIKELLNITK